MAHVGFTIPVGVCGVNGWNPVLDVMMEWWNGIRCWKIWLAALCPFFSRNLWKKSKFERSFSFWYRIKFENVADDPDSWIFMSPEMLFHVLVVSQCVSTQLTCVRRQQKVYSPANRSWIGNPSRCWSVDMLASLTKLDVRVGCRIVISCHQIYRQWAIAIGHICILYIYIYAEIKYIYNRLPSQEFPVLRSFQTLTLCHQMFFQDVFWGDPKNPKLN